MGIFLHSAFTKFIDLIFSVIITIFLIKFFGSLIFGIYQYNLAFTLFLGVFVIFNNVGEVYFKKEKNKILVTSISINLLIYSIIYYFIIFFLTKLDPNIKIDLVSLLVIDLFLNTQIGLIGIYLIAKNHYTIVNLYLIILRFLQVLIIISLYFSDYINLESFKIYLLIILLFKTIVFVYLLLRYNFFQIKFLPNFKETFLYIYKSEYRKIYIPRSLTAISGFIKQFVPIYFVGYFIDISTVTVVKVIIQSYELGIKFMHSIVIRIIPRINDQIENLSLSNLKTIDRIYFSYNFLIVIAIFLALDKLIFFLNLGETDYYLGIGNFEYFYALSFLISSISYRHYFQLHVKKNHNFLYLISSSRLATFIIIQPYFLYKFGILGLAYFYIIDYIINNLIIFNRYSKLYGKIKLNIYENVIFIIFILCLVIFGMLSN